MPLGALTLTALSLHDFHRKARRKERARRDALRAARGAGDDRWG